MGGASLARPSSRQQVPQAGGTGNGSRAQPRSVGNSPPGHGRRVRYAGPCAAGLSGGRAGVWARVSVLPLTASP